MLQLGRVLLSNLVQSRDAAEVEYDRLAVRGVVVGTFVGGTLWVVTGLVVWRMLH